jgi:hypothetical protein
MPVARQQIPNMHQWISREEVLRMWSMWLLHDTTEDLLEAVFSMWFVPRCYEQNKFRVQLVGRQLLASNGLNMEAEEPTALEAITRWLVTTMQTKKT